MKVTLVVEDFTSPFTDGFVSCPYLVLEDSKGNKTVVNGSGKGKKIPNGMTVEEYKNSNLRGIFSYVTYPELIRANSELKQLAGY